MNYHGMNMGDIVAETFRLMQEKCSKLVKLNIIVAGKTGVGKSTLINELFSERLAETGMGQPVTQHMKKYTKKDFPLCIYDTKGFELGKNAQDEVKEEIINTIKEQNMKCDINEAIHCILYCINAGSDRIEEEEQLWLESFAEESKQTQVPIILVLTQAIQKTRAEKFASYIDDLNLHIKQIVPVLALDAEITDDMIVPAYGLDKLVQVMGNALPEELLETFIRVQRASIKEKEKRATATMIAASSAAFGEGFIPLPFADAAAIVPTQIGMLASISVIFGLEVSEGTMMTILTAALGCSAATMGGKAVANAIKLIPGIGTLVGGMVSGGTAAAFTTALGSAYIKLLVMYANDEISEEDFNSEKSGDIMKDLMKNA